MSGMEFDAINRQGSTTDEVVSVYCPNCKNQVEAAAAACSHCSADFTSPAGWHPVAIIAPEPTEAATHKLSAREIGGQVMVRLWLSPILFVVVCVIAITQSFTYEALIFMYILLGGWVLYPLLRPRRLRRTTENERCREL